MTKIELASSEIYKILDKYELDASIVLISKKDNEGSIICNASNLYEFCTDVSVMLDSISKKSNKFYEEVNAYKSYVIPVEVHLEDKSNLGGE